MTCLWCQNIIFHGVWSPNDPCRPWHNQETVISYDILDINLFFYISSQVTWGWFQRTKRLHVYCHLSFAEIIRRDLIQQIENGSWYAKFAIIFIKEIVTSHIYTYHAALHREFLQICRRKCSTIYYWLMLDCQMFKPPDGDNYRHMVLCISKRNVN